MAARKHTNGSEDAPQWLKAGFVENQRLFPTTAGTPQGGIVSPLLANLTLDGMEQTIRSQIKRRDQVNFIRYADDFVVTAATKKPWSKRLNLSSSNSCATEVSNSRRKRPPSLTSNRDLISWVNDCANSERNC